ncbi:MAG TPA: FMN-binding protein [Draconibacterium sp.]|nr:FMN-binding protein [Draconibacterium sp.]
MKFFSIVTLLIISLATTVAGADDFYPEEQALKAAKKALKDKEIIITKTITTDASELKVEPVAVYLCENKTGESFYLLITQSKGRYDYFDYLLQIDENFTITKACILKYRSEHGGEIASRKWLTQFEGYSSGELHYKKDISAISGATISARSITADIPKVIELLKTSCH